MIGLNWLKLKFNYLVDMSQCCFCCVVANYKINIICLCRLSSVADTGGGGQTRPMPPLTNKDTPPVHCNEFNYMSSATHCRSSCRPRPVVRVKYHP